MGFPAAPAQGRIATDGDRWRALSQVSTGRADKARQQGRGYETTFYEQESKRSLDYASRTGSMQYTPVGYAPQMGSGANDFRGFVDREPELANVFDRSFMDWVNQASGGVGRNSYTSMPIVGGGGGGDAEAEFSTAADRPLPATSADMHRMERQAEDAARYLNPNRPSAARPFGGGSDPGSGMKEWGRQDSAMYLQPDGSYKPRGTNQSTMSGMGMSEVSKYRAVIPSDFIPTNDTEGLYSPAQAKEMQDAMVRQRKVDAQDKAARDFRAYLDRTTQPEGWDYSQPKTAPIDDRFYPQAIGRSAGMALNSMSMFSAFNPTPPIFAPRPGTAWSPFMSRNKFTRGF